MKSKIIFLYIKWRQIYHIEIYLTRKIIISSSTWIGPSCVVVSLSSCMFSLQLLKPWIEIVYTSHLLSSFTLIFSSLFLLILSNLLYSVKWYVFKCIHHFLGEKSKKWVLSIMMWQELNCSLFINPHITNFPFSVFWVFFKISFLTNFLGFSYFIWTKRETQVEELGVTKCVCMSPLSLYNALSMFAKISV